eukprot:CAMPEP_0201868392 /NCGR_PEP_ID=MMETSP0902-20130614/2296_1 /ASSEMBLY_ACC=CAM_ASM_000551 /TAXON_ID=420261 /ORGANISM="Thalassiosira antarctica, Strain CCMP982" /LENGTH=211 /DNA_ID=CAMNT_0048393731 /DNA_START=14 /DNA_END=649 /DNA_ORIENTATION=+
MMNSLSIPTIFIVTILVIISCTNAFTTPTPKLLQPTSHHHERRISIALASSASSASGAQESSSSPITPKTFREGEVLGLRLMQDGSHEEALKAFKKAMTLPGSRSDFLRTANVPGPSPVGGSKGGTEGRAVQTLDEFEYQAAHYNMACAYASLGNVGETVANLRKAFDYGFDNYATVRADPDLGSVQGSTEFKQLMDEFDKKFNPFGVFGK